MGGSFVKQDVYVLCIFFYCLFHDSDNYIEKTEVKLANWNFKTHTKKSSFISLGKKPTDIRLKRKKIIFFLVLSQLQLIVS